VGSSELADNAVDTNAIQDQAVALSKLPHGDGSSDGKFLRANNGADPTFETVTTTNINGNVDHRVITATGTAQQVQGESGLTYNGSTLGVSGSVAMTGGSLSLDGHSLVGTANFTDISGGSYAARLGSTGSSTIRSTQIYGGGGLIATFDGVNNRLGIGTTTPASPLHLHGSSSGSIEGLKVTNSTTGTGITDGLSIGLDSSENVFMFNYESTAMKFGTADTERMRIDGSGNIWLNGNGSYNTDRQVFNADGTSGLVEATNELNIFQNKSSSGGLYIGYKDIANGGTITDYHFYNGQGNGTKANISCEYLMTKGVDFGVTSNTSGMESEVLDDYEEGSWTPTLSNSQSITVHQANYLKVGGLVHISVYVTIGSNSNSNGLFFSNLPFAEGNNGYPLGAAYTQTTGATHIFNQVNKNSTNVEVLQTAGSSLSQSSFSGAYVLFSNSYTTY